MKKLFLYIFFISVYFSVNAQIVRDSVRIYADSIVPVDVAEPLPNAVLEFSDSLPVDAAVVDADTTTYKADSVFKPDPLRAVWLGAIIPGYGQIVNRKYWKLPIVYGGFLGFAYAISWNNSRYVSYKNAYRDIIDDDPTTNYYLDILPRGYTLENYPGGRATYTQRLKSAQDQFRQYRDLSIILSIGYYALVLLEAYVDAHLYDFDISPDLVLNVTPTRIDFNQHQNVQSGYGFQCSIRF